MVKHLFSTDSVHRVTEANINFYTSPFVHPTRVMAEHDFIYLLDGEWKFGQNNEEYTLKKDSLLILGAGQRHYGAAPCTAGTKTMYFHVTCEEGDAVLPATDPRGIVSVTDASRNENIRKYMSRTVNAALSGQHRRADLWFELLLCELTEAVPDPADTAQAQQIRNIIHIHPEKFFSNRELAQMLNVSVKTAETKFKAEFGTTIHQYILRFKVEEAISYFETFPQFSIKEIAHNLGFYDEYHFSKQFKSITGLAPAHYRKQHKCPVLSIR